MAIGICEIAFCVNESIGIVGAVRDLPWREGDAVTYVSLNVCASHEAMFDGADHGLAVDARNVLIERPNRKPVDWCRICGGPCAVGHPSSEFAHTRDGNRALGRDAKHAERWEGNR